MNHSSGMLGKCHQLKHIWMWLNFVYQVMLHITKVVDGNETNKQEKKCVYLLITLINDSETTTDALMHIQLNIAFFSYSFFSVVFVHCLSIFFLSQNNKGEEEAKKMNKST